LVSQAGLKHWKIFDNMVIEQVYSNYNDEDQRVWQVLFDRQMEQLPLLAASAYLEGIEKSGLTREKIPDFIEVNNRLSKITGWKVEAVEGLIPNKDFFELLSQKKFPASTWLRKMNQLDYLEEPDMFHDVFGHVPLLTNNDFCNFLKGLSEIALKVIDRKEAIEHISRIYWYTVEFGLIEKPSLLIYGAGILSSGGESVYALKSEAPKRIPYQVNRIASTPYIKDKFQLEYFVIESFEQLFNSLPEIECVILN
jgi:phenylalanine-4-hydroxylase